MKLKSLPNFLAIISLLFLLSNCKKNIVSGGDENQSRSNRLTNCSNVTVQYNRIDVTYDSNLEMLVFNSLADFFSVADALNSDYDSHNDNFDATYSSYDENQLDSIEAVIGFDEFQTYKVFEENFPCFVSKRSELQIIEEEWLDSDFESIDPDDLDFTFDEGENALFNTN